MDFLDTSGLERLWQHIIAKIGTKADLSSISTLQSEIDEHAGNTNVHITSAERTKLSGIETGAQKNTVTGIKGNSESSYRTGNVNITAANIGLGNVSNTSDADKPVSTAQQAAINEAEAAAKLYADSAATNVKNDLLNGAGAAYDTLKELGDLIDDNTDAITALEEVATGKADKTHTHTISDVTNLQSTINAMQGEIDANESSISLLEPVVTANKEKLDKIELGASSITWDGDTTGLESYVDTYFKVSNIILNMNDIIGKTVVFVDDTGTYSYEIDYSMINTDDVPSGAYTVNTDLGAFIIVLTEPADLTGTGNMSAGIYFINMESYGMVGYVSELTLGDGEPITITSGGTGATNPQGARTNLDVYSKAEVDGKVFGSGGGSITWDGDTAGLEVFDGIAYKVSDLTPSMDGLVGQTVVYMTINDQSGETFDENSYEITPDMLKDLSDMGASGFMCSSTDGSDVFEFMVLNEEFEEFSAGIYFWNFFGIYTAELTLPQIGGHSHPSIESAISKLEESIVPADWKVNDPSSPAYIANRPFYTEEPVLTTIVDNTTITLSDYNGLGTVQNPFALTLEEGIDYVVTWNGTDYNATCTVMDGLPAIGNGSIFGMGDDTGEPFIIGASGGTVMLYATSAGSATVTIKRDDAEVHKISPKYIDMPKGAYVGENTGVGEIFNDYENNVATGSYSHAEGAYTEASGHWSHAEGYHAKAYGQWSHAEGYATKARGQAQHVQGKYNIEDTSDVYAHIVGNGTSTSARSNAHTLDWDGNAWYQGTLKVGGTSYADASEVATKAYIEELLGVIENGSY